MKKSVCFLIAMAMCTSLASCGDSNSKYEKNADGIYTNPDAKAVVMIIGNHACAMKAPDSLYDILEKNLDDIVYGGYFSLINADSTPTKVDVADTSFFDATGRNKAVVESEKANRKKKIIPAIKEAAEIPPDSEQTDLLQALREAKSILSSCSASHKEIIIADTGISTAGDFNFCSMKLNESSSERRSPESIIDEYLKNFEGHNLLPDLTDIDVVFYGQHGNMAPAAAPQSESMLTSDEQYIKEIWETLVKDCGAKSIDFVEVAGWDTPIVENDDIPFVQTVIFKRLVAPDPPVINEDIVPDPPLTDISFSDAQMGFNPDTATLKSLDNFISQESIVDAIMRIQIYLEQNPDKKIYIAGSTAKFGDGNGYELSRKRGQVIADLLTNGAFEDNNGNKIYIKSEQVAIIGMGNKFPDKVDEYPEGTFTEEFAAQNRRVFIFNEDSESDSGGENYYTKLKKAYDDGELNPETMADAEKVFK